MGQQIVRSETNERGELSTFIDKLFTLYGNTNLLEVISVDAGITSIKNAAHIVDHGLHYIMALKDPRSRKATRTAIELLESKKVPDRQEEEHVNGKDITRKFFCCAAPAMNGWEHAKELWRIEKTVIYSSGKITTEDHYYITSLPKSRLSNKQKLKTVRLHWGIENNANWVMDTAWKEDSTPWCRQALSLVSLLRVIAYNTVARLKIRRLRKARSMPWYRVLYIIKSILFPINSVDSAFA